MDKIYFEVNDDAVVKHTPVFEVGGNIYTSEVGANICRTEVVMTKEIFQECYKKWVEPQQVSISDET